MVRDDSRDRSSTLSIVEFCNGRTLLKSLSVLPGLRLSRHLCILWECSMYCTSNSRPPARPAPLRLVPEGYLLYDF